MEDVEKSAEGDWSKKRDLKALQKDEEDKNEDQNEVIPSSNGAEDVVLPSPTDSWPAHIIKEGDKVLLVDNVGRKNLVKLRPAKKYKLIRSSGIDTTKTKNLFISGSEIIGCTYGSILEIKGKKATVKEGMHSLDQDIHSLNINDDEIENDNRDINDESHNQNMWYEEIEYRKSQGVTGQELVNQIVENSTTFAKRTQFSKEKYLRKLKKRHINLVELRYPSLFNVWEYAYELQERRMVNIRYDTLSYILNYSNVTCTSKALVLDNTKGLVTAGLVERMNGEGDLTFLILQDNPVANLQSQVPYMFKMNHLHGNNISFINYRNLHKKNPTMDLIKSQMKEKFTSWVLVHDKHSPRDLFTLVYPYLKPSCYVTVFCEYIQPIADLERHVRSNKLAVMVQLEDFWTREYQVLPLRTHPHMSMTNDSGYVLTFILVEPGK